MLPLLWILLNMTAISSLSTLSLHDALPIFAKLLLSGWIREQRTIEVLRVELEPVRGIVQRGLDPLIHDAEDRKSTRLNSSHRCISYAVFCLKKKKRCVVVRD